MTQKFAFRKGFDLPGQNVTVYSHSFERRKMKGFETMEIMICKSLRRLKAVKEGKIVLECPVALGRVPTGAKRCEGDGRTPEGAYAVCLVKEQGKYGRSLGLSYPNAQDAQCAFSEGRIDERTLQNILLAQAEGRRPPWGSPLGGEIYIHEGGTHSDWTQGCIALESADMDVLFPWKDEIEQVQILP